jgi:hypothetical protein
MRCGVTALGSSSLRSECRYGQSRHTAFALSLRSKPLLRQHYASVKTLSSKKPLLTGLGPRNP